LFLAFALLFFLLELINSFLAALKLCNQRLIRDSRALPPGVLLHVGNGDTFGGVWVQNFVDKILCLIREVCAARMGLPEESMLVVVELVEPPIRVAGLLERRKSGEHDEEDNSARPDIGSEPVIAFALEHLWSHVARSATFSQHQLAGFPPFQKPSNSDWWFNKLNNNKHALFWQAHSRSAYFSDATKDFINKILNPDPAKRISIADMKKHPWWKGPTVTNAALVAELLRRKNTVDTLKEKEKERKRQEQRAAALDGDVVMRGEGAWGADDLPFSPPKLTFKNYVFRDPTPGAVAAGLGFDGPLGFAEPEEKSVRSDPKPLPEAVRYTRFDSNLAPDRILERVCDVIGSSGGKFVESKGAFKMKANFGRTTFVIEVFAHPEAKDAFVVDFRKKQGSGVEFREFYQDIRSQLVDVVLQPKVAAEPEAEAAAPVAAAAEAAVAAAVE